MDHKCPRCQNEDHPNDAKFCKICGMKVGSKVAAGTTTNLRFSVEKNIDIDAVSRRLAQRLDRQIKENNLSY